MSYTFSSEAVRTYAAEADRWQPVPLASGEHVPSGQKCPIAPTGTCIRLWQSLARAALTAVATPMVQRCSRIQSTIPSLQEGFLFRLHVLIDLVLRYRVSLHCCVEHIGALRLSLRHVPILMA